ncbi:MAG: Uma2 family endonuclease [Actinomycetota bacterium]
MVTASRRARPLDYDDLARFPDDGHRKELIEGSLHMAPAPTPRHQYCVLALAELLRRVVPEGRIVLAAPVDVIFAPGSVHAATIRS